MLKLFLVVAFSCQATAQCDFEGDIIVADDSNVSIDVLVSGATNNNLDLNALQAVIVHFEHDFISDLTIELEAPSGEKVTLVGANQIGPNTNLQQSWEIKFFNEEKLVAIPDPDHEALWNSISLWLGFTTFTGSYYPYSGSLADFTGSVNGIWKVNLSDVSAPFEGIFTCLGLVFCEEDGIVIESCSPVESSLNEPAISYCEGDENLNLEIIPSLEEEYDSLSYTYTYLLFEDDKFVEHTNETNFTSYSEGSYTLCGIHYFIEDQINIESIPVDSSFAGVDSYISSSGSCAKLSDECIEINIFGIPTVVTSEQILCMGDTIIIGGEEYFEEGIYEILTEQSPCDSTSFLDLTIVSATFDLKSNFSAFSCLNDTLSLDASDSSIPEDAFFRWTTNDGQFISNALNEIVEIDKPGTYTFEVESMGCLFSETLIIGEEEDFSYTTIAGSEITCLNEKVLIDLVTEDAIVDISWVGAGTFTMINEDIEVTEGGTYSVNFTTEFGCDIYREISIEDNRVFPTFNLIGDTISCNNPMVIITSSTPDQWNSTYTWIFDDSVLGNDFTQVATEPGEYTLRTTTAEGCVDSFLIDIPSSVQIINPELIFGTIDCQQEGVDVAYVTDLKDLIPIWTLPDVSTLVDSTFYTELEGMYSLHLADKNGCEIDTTFEILKDITLPSVEIQDALFQCGVDSLILEADVDMDNVTYTWYSSENLLDTIPNPTIFAPGEYSVEVCLENGCCSTDTIDISSNMSVPMLTFETQNIDCNQDTVFIIPSDTSSYEMNWKLNNVSFVTSSNVIMVTAPGTYEVEVIDMGSGCKAVYFFDIIEDKENELNGISTNTLNCINEEVTLSVDSPNDVESYLWDGPGLLDTSLDPNVNLPGEYILQYTFTNGCSNIDTIEVFSEGELPNLMSEDKVFNCFADFVTLEVAYESSSISITWDGPGTSGATGETLIANEPGIYTAFAVAPGACRDTLEIEVVADTIHPVLSIVNDGRITCSDSIVTIDLTTDANTASYSFLGPGIVQQNGQSIDVDKPGVYTGVGVGANGCETMVTTTVEISTDFPDYTIDLDSITCVMDEVNVGFASSDADLNVLWEGPEAVAEDAYGFTTSLAGSYIFTLTNSDGCEISDSIIVFRDTFPPTGIININNQITCEFSEATLSIDGLESSTNVNWSGPGVVDPQLATFTTDQIGDYNLILVGENGCISEETMTLRYDTIAPEINIIGDPLTCLAGKVFLRIDSDLEIREYEWEGPNSFTSDDVEPLVFEEGEYYVTITSENGCISEDVIFIEDQRVFPEVEIDDFYLPCDNSPVLVTYSSISEGAVIRWFGPNDYFVAADTAEVLVEGEHVGIAISPEGCSFSDTFAVIDEPVLPLFAAESDVILCFGEIEMRALDTDDDRSVFWQGPQGYISDMNPAMTDVPGIYTLTVTGSNGCIDTTEIEVLDGRVYPDAFIELRDPFQCANTEVFLYGEGSSSGEEYTYQWSTEDGIILNGDNGLTPTVQGEGSYILTVLNTFLGCESNDTLILIEEEQDFVGITVETMEPTCSDFENASIDIIGFDGGFGPYNIIVDGNDYGERQEILYLSGGDHSVSIEDSLGCVIDTVITIEMTKELLVVLPSDTTLTLGQDLNVTADISLSPDSISQISWSSNVPCDGCQTFNIQPSGNMTITVEVTDIDGCKVTEEFRILLNRPDKPPFPQIFSPNNDGVNDFFYMPMTSGINTINLLRIYDNWGGLLYDRTDISPGEESQGWDGSVNGQQAAMGVYIVHAVLTLSDGTEVSYIGDVTLIR